MKAGTVATRPSAVKVQGCADVPKSSTGAGSYVFQIGVWPSSSPVVTVDVMPSTVEARLPSLPEARQSIRCVPAGLVEVVSWPTLKKPARASS